MIKITRKSVLASFNLGQFKHYVFLIFNFQTMTTKQNYKTNIAPELKRVLERKNIYDVPRVTKIVLNVGLGEALQNSKILASTSAEVERITAQKAVFTRSKKAVSSFKLRPNMPVGVKVYLRRDRMYAFLDRLVRLALPRIRDFQGLDIKSFDMRGNYSLGLEEQLMFPEIQYDQIDAVRGMDITIVTSAKTKFEGFQCLRGHGLPFNKTNVKENEFF